MRNNKLVPIVALTLWVILIAAGLAACQQANQQTMGVTNLDSLHLKSAEGTATPILMVQNDNSAGESIEVRNSSATPVFIVHADGSADYTGFSSAGGTVDGDTTITGTLVTSEGITATSGGLNAVAGGVNVTAGGVNVTAGGVNVTAGGVSVTAGDLNVTGNITASGDLVITGATTLNGGLTMDTDAFAVSNTSGNTVIKGTLTTTGATTLNGGLTMDTTKFTVADTSGNTQVGGTLGVTGATTLTGDVTASSNLTVTNKLGIGSVDFTGPIQYGTGNCTAGVIINHSLGTTPTVVNATIYSTTLNTALTQTIVITGLTSSGFYCSPIAGAYTTLPILWMAGK